MKCKCKGCDERHIGCHSECDAYKQYQKYCEGIRKERSKYRDVDCHIFENKMNIREYKMKRDKTML